MSLLGKLSEFVKDKFSESKEDIKNTYDWYDAQNDTFLINEIGHAYKLKLKEKLIISRILQKRGYSLEQLDIKVK